VTVDLVVCRGDLVALAGPEWFWIIAPWLLDRPADDPHVRFVTLMCHCRRQVEIGDLLGRTRASWPSFGRAAFSSTPTPKGTSATPT
jgi:hypothetical protein